MSERKSFDPTNPDDTMNIARATGYDLVSAAVPLLMRMPPSGQALFWITLLTFLTGAAEGNMGRAQTRAMLVKLIAALDDTAQEPRGAVH